MSHDEFKDGVQPETILNVTEMQKRTYRVIHACSHNIPISNISLTSVENIDGNK